MQDEEKTLAYRISQYINDAKRRETEQQWRDARAIKEQIEMMLPQGSLVELRPSKLRAHVIELVADDHYRLELCRGKKEIIQHRSDFIAIEVEQ